MGQDQAERNGRRPGRSSKRISVHQGYVEAGGSVLDLAAVTMGYDPTRYLEKNFTLWFSARDLAFFFTYSAFSI